MTKRDEIDHRAGSVKKNTSLLQEADPLLTVKEVAQYLRLKPSTIRSMIKRGDLVGIKVGRSWRFKQSYIQEKISDSNSK